MRRIYLVLLLLALAACCPPAVASAQAATGSSAEDAAGTVAAEPIDRATATARFDSAWDLVNQRYWGLESAPVDWDEVGERYRARLAEIVTTAELYALLESMYDELGDDHSTFVPPARVAEIRATYGDLPCVAVFGSAASWPRTPAGVSSTVVTPFLVVVGELGFSTETRANVEFGMTETSGVKVGYLRVPDLVTDGAADAVRRSVTSLERAGARALVLDLRGNPGGRLITMMQVAGVFTRGFLWRTVTNWALPLPYPAIGTVATELPLVVLIDGDVNSAAEGLAGALQANGRALIVGATSAGNVEAVLPFCLRDGSQAWIATGVLAPLVGPTWEGRGVVPDIAVAPEGALDAALARLGETMGAP